MKKTLPQALKEIESWSLDGDFHLWWSLEGENKLWHERFSTLLQIADNPIVVVCADASILDANDAAALHFGHTKKSLLGKSLVQDILLQTLETDGLAQVSKLLGGKETWSLSGEVLHRHARKGLIRWSTVRILDSARAPVGLIVYGQDITHEREVENRLKRTLKELEDEKRAIDQAAIVAITDVKGNITYTNDKFCELSKYSAEELLGQNHRVINSGYHPPEFFEGMWKSISAGKIWKGEIRNRAKDGTLYWVDTTIVPFMNEEGKPYRYVSIRTDISEKKRAQQQADEERLRAVYAGRLASLGEMAAGIAHELGTPLATIRGRMEFLEYQLERGNVEKGDLLTLASTIKEQADRMTRIIRGVLSSARDGSKDPLRSENIRKMIESILEYSTERFRKHGISVRIEENEKNLHLFCKETQIAQVFLNLVANACDAIKDLESRWICFEISDAGKFVEVAIIDSGQGISEDLAERVMQPFFTTKGVGHGTGLGLSISKKIVEDLGGSLYIDRQSENTKFVVRLPKKPSSVS